MDAVCKQTPRELALRQLGEFRDWFPGEPDNEEIVHQLRILTKRIRAYLWLLPEDLYPQITGLRTTLSQVARSYAGSRDATVLVTRFKELIETLAPEDRQQALRWFVATAPTPVEIALPPETEATLQVLEESLEHWASPGQEGWDSREGLERLYRKAGKIGRKALESGEAGMFHRWRKWTKHLHYSLEALADLPVGNHYRERLKSLGSDLGDYHDLVMLEAFLKDNLPLQEPSSGLVKKLLKIIDKRKHKARKQFSKDYRKLYSEPRLLRLPDHMETA